MKKLFFLLLVTTSVALTSCSKDENEEAKADAIAEATDSNGNSILGHWIKTDTNADGLVVTMNTREFTFNSDKTGIFKKVEAGEEDLITSLTWTKSGDAFTMYGDGEKSEPFTIGDSSDGTKALMYSDGTIIALKD